MRILTVRQPWAWAIIHGGKNVENRVRNIAGDYRGPVAIHVALRDDDEAFEPEHLMHGLLFGPCPQADDAGHNRYHCDWCTRVAPSKYGYKGCIIGVVDLVDVHLGSQLAGHCWHDRQGMRDRCSIWGEEEAVHLVLANPRALAEPFSYTGALGLRRLDPEAILAITRQIGRLS